MARERTPAHGARYIKKGCAHLRNGLPIKLGFVDEHRDQWPVRPMCNILGLSASGDYAWRERPESPRAAVIRALLEEIRVIHTASSGTYGSPRVQAVLRAYGRRIGHSRIERLMRRAGIRGLAALPRRMRTTDSRHDNPIAPNLLGRNFTTTQPNKVWLADITYVATNEGWLYVSGVLDLGMRKLVGWLMNETLHAEGALEALRMAINRQRPLPGLIHHSDRGIRPIGIGDLSVRPRHGEHHAVDEPEWRLPG